ncbi:hypothetical protein SAMN04487910_0325 [Aquimarina amphilecti]|uniref:Uncharacterized protein n=1 Tax=Aquimarina amphilecti TaxID=1038014 RepID=A0A1H7GB84_AQUAM|nr:hypothetical protein [Aquimarina amphilecti]SEK35378.1 hypothetical protein SAMN04487910_0325 [Aquimarina amphilecti]
MKNLWILLLNILFINLLNSQSMHTEEELKIFKEKVNQTIELGRTSIIDIAAKTISINSESLFNDEKVLISVWYNNAEVKVEFRERSPIKYLTPGAEVYFKVTVKVSVDRVSGSGGSVVRNSENKTSRPGFSPTYLYRSTNNTKAAIDHVLELNNTNDPKYHIDESSQIYTIIREQKGYYDIQIYDRYSITYKIDKKSGKIFDYENPYENFYPTPASAPHFPMPFGPWVEMKK